jgi:two-component system LytT family sensor kinase
MTRIPREERSTPQRLRSWNLALGFWTLLALSYTVTSFISALNEGEPASWLRTLGWNLLNCYLWMGLTPWVAWLGRRGAQGGWPRFWAWHAPGSLGTALAQSLCMLWIYWIVFGARPGSPITTFTGYVQVEFAYKLHVGLITYWVLLVVLRSVESQRRLRDERLKNSQLETQLVQSQLQTLRVQLQPHFLFNTLNAISALALSDPLQARAMIARLSDFLRLTLEERHTQLVPLARELEFLRCYLDIQQVRFRDRLVTRLDVAEDTARALVPSMILQPLVENALRHGLLAKPASGSLAVVTRREADELHLEVQDDGLGLPPGGAREGFGLSNTRARLEMLFGAAARLQLERRADGGTRVALWLPFREAPA